VSRGPTCSRGSIGATSLSSRQKRTQSFRIFFSWARITGRLTNNPTARLTVRGVSGPPRLDFPAPWSEAFDQWAKFMRTSGKPDTTINLRRAQLARVGRELGIDPWDVTTDDLVDWLSSKHWSRNTRRSHRRTLRAFFKWAVMFGHVDADPTINIPAVPVAPGLPRPAPDDRIKFALAGSDSRVRLMILLAAMMGLRRGEIAKLHTDDITENGLMVHGKGARTRLVPIPPVIAQPLAGVPRGFVFRRSFDGRPLSAAHVGKLISERLGEGVTAHMLRHRFATVAYSAERDLRAVQTLLGHSSPDTTAVYAEVAEMSLTTAVAKAAEL
jgi:integrase